MDLSKGRRREDHGPPKISKTPFATKRRIEKDTLYSSPKNIFLKKFNVFPLLFLRVKMRLRLAVIS
jgi:hypothetical protein